MSERNCNEESERRSIKRKSIRERNKELTKIEKKSGQRAQRRLGFLYDILDATNMNWRQLAERGGVITPQSLNWWCVSDDAYLGSIQRVMSAVNINVRPIFKGYEYKAGEPQIKEEKQFKYEISGNLIGELKKEKAEKTSLMALIGQACEQEKRLTFLAVYFKQRLDRNDTLTAIAEDMETTQFAIRNFLINDDIKISKIYTLAENAGLKLVWDINKTGEIPENPKNRQ